MSESDLTTLQSSWKTLYQTALPNAAKAKSPSQPKWPVHNDHCFARIILDNVVGVDAPWTSKIKGPAWKNMSRTQLESCISLGGGILEGSADLAELDDASLSLRGKAAKGSTSPRKRKREEKEGEEISRFFVKGKASPSQSKIHESEPTPKPNPQHPSLDPPTHDLLLAKIHASLTLTPFRCLVLSALLQVPRGQYTTYGLLSTHLHSSPRAVGNALRNNPFAPEVPCHRVLASGGGLGGFGGSWGKRGEQGKNDGEKRRLLRAEGVRFDGGGRVVGRPWGGFS